LWEVVGRAWMLGGAFTLAVLAGPQARGQAKALSIGPGEADTEAPLDHPQPPESNADPARGAYGAGQGIKRLAGDQLDLWTSPSRIRSRDVTWLLTLGGVTASLLLTDHDIMQHNTLSPTTMKRSVDFSNYGLGALVGVGGALFLWGKKNGDDHKEETGLLSGESALNALAIATALGYAFGRERPNVDGAQGKFFQGGKSFPSDHSAVAWSIASMVAHQYPGRMTKALAYGLAGAVSVARVTGNQHFPSDVVVGGALGWMIARQMYVKHHDPDLGGAPWGSGASGNASWVETLNPKHFASTYVPLDSWVYPDLERLAGLGYIHSQFMSSRPWSRNECARLTQEAGEYLQDGESRGTQAGQIYDALEQEFYPEIHPDVIPSPGLRLESVYTRLGGISGQPLNDSYHFGQTLINDFGRPYQEGFDPVAGISGWANWGRFTLYSRGEYQHSPSAPAYSQDVRDLIAQIDDNPVQPASPVETINRFNLLDTYALTKLSKFNFSFGKQSGWWGPNDGGSLLLSNNAEPIYMFRVMSDSPVTLPWIFKYFGPVKGDFFMGQLAGNEFPPRPLFHGEMVMCKPTKYWEFGFSRTAEFGGVGRPITWGSVFNTYFATKSSVWYPAWNNPGQRNGGFNFSYQVPKLRDWLTVYGTAMSRDDPTPLVAFTPLRALINPGFYLSHIPHVPRMDLRGEAVVTNPPAAPNNTGNFAYWESFYHDNYTNKKNLMGDWIGRVGTGYQGWTTYWFSPRTTLQLGYRHAQVASTFIPRGGTMNDGSVKFNYQVGTSLTFSAFVQYEQWLMPVLAPEAKNNVTTSVQITWWPAWWGLKK